MRNNLFPLLITNKFSQLRIDKKLNREELAVELGVSTTAVVNVENDPHHNPSIRTVLKYCKYFGVPIMKLISDEDIKIGDEL